MSSTPLTPEGSGHAIGNPGIVSLLKRAYSLWTEHKAARLGAALAYYTVFSLAPLVVIAISVASLVFGKTAAEGAIEKQLQDTVGSQARRRYTTWQCTPRRLAQA